MSEMPINPTELRSQAAALRLHGLLAHWSELMADAEAARRVAQWLAWESAVRAQRSLERRVRAAHIGQFKPLADFDWRWPTQIDRAAIEELMTLQFMADATNVVLVGGNGLGKTLFACNLGYQAVLAGHTVLFVTAGHLLGDLAALDSDSTLRRRLRHYAAPDLLLIDEVGYLSYSNRHADLLFELVSRRYQHKSTVVTTNKAFADWGEVFPNAACVVSLVDRLMHRAEVVHRGRLLPGQGGAGAHGRARQAAFGQGERHRQGQVVRRRDTPPPWLPTHWSPEQALAVFECLHALREQLWAMYASDVQKAWCDQLVHDQPLPEFDPNDPF